MCTLKENGRQAGKHLEKSPSASAFSSGRVGLEDPSQMPLSPSSSVSGHMCLPITFINSIDGHQFKRCQRSQLPLTSVGELRPLFLLKKLNDGWGLFARSGISLQNCWRGRRSDSEATEAAGAALSHYPQLVGPNPPGNKQNREHES